MANTFGSYRESHEETFRRMDLLPAGVRVAVAYSPYPLAVQPILRAWQGGEPEVDLILRCGRVRPGAVRAAYGPDHPEANP